eukprot:59539-Chlamydomonas_euryale.AAC.2
MFVCLDWASSTSESKGPAHRNPTSTISRPRLTASQAMLRDRQPSHAARPRASSPYEAWEAPAATSRLREEGPGVRQPAASSSLWAPATPLPHPRAAAAPRSETGTHRSKYARSLATVLWTGAAVQQRCDTLHGTGQCCTGQCCNSTGQCRGSDRDSAHTARIAAPPPHACACVAPVLRAGNPSANPPRCKH